MLKMKALREGGRSEIKYMELMSKIKKDRHVDSNKVTIDLVIENRISNKINWFEMVFRKVFLQNFEFPSSIDMLLEFD